jgi:hypothetical protein
MVARMKMTVFWDLPSCSLEETDISEVLTASIISPDDAGSTQQWLLL